MPGNLGSTGPNAPGWNNWQVMDVALDPEQQTYNQSYFMCTLCEYNEEEGTMIWSVNPAVAALFNDIVADSNNPASALQATFTMLSTMALYDWTPMFDISGSASLVLQTAAAAPVTWTGLLIVLAILAAHCILHYIIVAFFAVAAPAELLGNAWFAMTQVTPLVDDEIHGRGLDMATDDEVRKALKTSGDDKVRVGILKPGKRNSSIAARLSRRIMGAFARCLEW